MAIITLPSQPTAGHAIGQAMGGGLAGFGQGLGAGISNIINMKLQNMQKRQQQQSLQGSLAPLVGPEKAQLYSELGAENPQVLGNLLKLEMEAPGQTALAEALGAPPAGPITGMQPTLAQAPIEAVPSPTMVTPTREVSPVVEKIEVPKAVGIKQKEVFEKEIEPQITTEDVPIKPVLKTIKKSDATDISPLKRQADRLTNDIDRIRNVIGRGVLNSKQLTTANNILTQKERALGKLLTAEKQDERSKKQFDAKQKLKEKQFKLQERRYLDEFSAKERAEKAKKQKEIDAETKDTYKSVVKQHKAANDDEIRLARMKELNDKGYFGSSIANSVVKAASEGIFGFGIDLGFLRTADAQEFDKLSTDFLKNVKDVFGARVTQQEVKMYLKRIPTLMQSRDGRAKVIRNLQLFNDIAKARFNVMNDLITENKGQRPKNMEAKIEKRMTPALETIKKVFANQPIGTEKRTALREFFGIPTAGIN